MISVVIVASIFFGYVIHDPIAALLAGWRGKTRVVQHRSQTRRPAAAVPFVQKEGE